jgi:DNA repair exonuclease SbcCD nuclease subunit
MNYVGEVRVAITGDVHLEEERFFLDTKLCLEWFVQDGIDQGVSLFVVNGDLTTYKATIRERNLWIDMLIRMADHAPVIVTAGNHGKELEGDLYVYSRAKGKNPIYLCTEPEFLDVGELSVAVFPYPRKAEMLGEPGDKSLEDAFASQLQDFAGRFERRREQYRLFVGHFGVRGARVSKGQPLAGRCAEYPLDPLRDLPVQHVGLSHVHLRQQLAPRVWYCGTLSRCDFSEAEEEKGYHLLQMFKPSSEPDLSDVKVEFRPSPARDMREVHVRYDEGKFIIPCGVNPANLKEARVKVIVTVGAGAHQQLSREAQQELRDRFAAAGPAELRVKIEREPEPDITILPLTQAHSAEEKLRAYWMIKEAPPEDQQQRVLQKLAELEARLCSED